jgi:radical SAM protein with 4Fe4S-binding SPASM domain
VRQYNISLHDAEENIPKEKRGEYLYSVFDFAKEKSKESYFSFRLWNQGSEASSEFNRDCIDTINACFGVNISADMLEKEMNIKIKDRVFLQSSFRFFWPGERALGIQRRTCYALKDHVAILVDGTVVPCCLDANAQMPLGNIFEEDFDKIINGDRAQQILSGFQKRIVSEKTCMDCGFFPSKQPR